jgi:hypothetical protein
MIDICFQAGPVLQSNLTGGNRRGIDKTGDVLQQKQPGGLPMFVLGSAELAMDTRGSRATLETTMTRLLVDWCNPGRASSVWMSKK